MALSRGRVLRGDGGVTLEVSDTDTVEAKGRVITRRLLESERESIRMLGEAKLEASRILAEAREQLGSVREEAEREGKAAGAAALAAHWARSRDEEAKALAKAEDRVLLIARALAERLLGRELASSPEAVVDLARVALVAAARAKRVVVKAHPSDVEALRQAPLAEVLDGPSVEVQADPSRGIGCLRIETDIGVLDGDLAPQLDRLVAALRRP